jgi:hypothetical protein
MIGLIDRRRAEIAGSGLEARLADLRAASIAAGAKGNAGPRLTPQDGQAMGLPPERVAEVNRQLEAAERAAGLARGAALVPAGDAQAVPGQLPVEGEQAAENAAALRAWQEAWRARERSIADSPGNHVLQHDQATREAWNAALQDPARIGAAIAMTLSLQERIGIRAADRQAIPPSIATAIAGSIGELPTAAERMSRLQDILGQVLEEAQRQQLLAGLGIAGLPDGPRIGAAIAPRVGPLVASQIASELAVDAGKLTLPPGMTQQVQRAVTGVFDDSDRLGGLRAAQATVTGNAAFIELAARERRLLEQLGKVRAAASGSTGTSELRTAYGHLYGGNTILHRSGYMLVVPAGMDAARVQQGLAGILDRALQGATPQQRAIAARGTWVDGGTGQYVFYPTGSPSPLVLDGQAVQVTPAEAMAAPAAAVREQPRPGPTVVPPTLGMVLPPFGFR